MKLMGRLPAPPSGLTSFTERESPRNASASLRLRIRMNSIDPEKSSATTAAAAKGTRRR